MSGKFNRVVFLITYTLASALALFWILSIVASFSRGDESVHFNEAAIVGGTLNAIFVLLSALLICGWFTKWVFKSYILIAFLAILMITYLKDVSQGDWMTPSWENFFMFVTGVLLPIIGTVSALQILKKKKHVA